MQANSSVVVVKDVELAVSECASLEGTIGTSKEGLHGVDDANSTDSGSLKIGTKTYPLDNEYAAVCPANAPTKLSFKNLSVFTTAKNKDGKRKCILNNLEGCIGGGLWAVMGPSGSGKTTLLSSLALRLDTYRMHMQGTVLLNGTPYTKHDLKGFANYVMQDDLIHAHLTVQETLQYNAELRLGGTTSEERKKRIDEVIELMDIGHCRNVLVGDSRVKGISGGERKRLCVAIELLTKTKLLFLDEPTSGLDSTNALSVVRVLKNLVTRGECTVICTIHQPPSKTYAMFDNLILMTHGIIAYQGNALGALSYFERLGYPVTELTNPADHLIDTITHYLAGPERGKSATEGGG